VLGHLALVRRDVRLAGSVDQALHARIQERFDEARAADRVRQRMRVDLVDDEQGAGPRHAPDLAHGGGNVDVMQDVARDDAVEAVVGIRQPFRRHLAEVDVEPFALREAPGDRQRIGAQVERRHVRAQAGQAQRIFAEAAADDQHAPATQVLRDEIGIHLPVGVPPAALRPVEDVEREGPAHHVLVFQCVLPVVRQFVALALGQLRCVVTHGVPGGGGRTAQLRLVLSSHQALSARRLTRV